MGKKKQANKPKPCASCFEQLKHLPELESYHLKSNQLRILRKQHEIQESLNEILNEFLIDFKNRKEKRLTSKTPTLPMHPYNLVISRFYQNKIRKQINTLIASGHSEDLHDYLSTSIYKFVKSLESILNELKHMSKILQLVFLFDSYHTLQNASSEISVFYSTVYILQPNSVEYLFNKAFSEQILSGFQDTLNQAEDYDKSHFAIQGILKMTTDLNKLMQEPLNIEVKNSISEFTDLTESESEDNESEPLYNLPIEDLVIYIEGPKSKTPKTKRTASTSHSPPENLELDKEIDEFRQRIDIPISPERLQLKLSQEFLNNLRTLLLNSKNI